MNHFEYRERSAATPKRCRLSRIAEEVGTPAYVYSTATLERHFRVLDEAFASVPHLIATR